MNEYAVTAVVEMLLACICHLLGNQGFGRSECEFVCAVVIVLIQDAPELSSLDT